MPPVTRFATAVQTPCMISVHVTYWPSFNMLTSGTRLSYGSWWNETRQGGAGLHVVGVGGPRVGRKMGSFFTLTGKSVA